MGGLCLVPQTLIEAPKDVTYDGLNVLSPFDSYRVVFDPHGSKICIVVIWEMVPEHALMLCGLGLADRVSAVGALAILRTNFVTHLGSGNLRTE
jgi:hypothetical protein